MTDPIIVIVEDQPTVSITVAPTQVTLSETGMQGPPGADGPAGADGQPGADGADGSDANVTNANVNDAIDDDAAATRAALGITPLLPVGLNGYILTSNGTTFSWAAPAPAGVWGAITGTLSAQTDLQTALNAKFDDPAGTDAQFLNGAGAPTNTLNGPMGVGVAPQSDDTVSVYGVDGYTYQSLYSSDSNGAYVQFYSLGVGGVPGTPVDASVADYLGGLMWSAAYGGGTATVASIDVRIDGAPGSLPPAEMTLAVVDADGTSRRVVLPSDGRVELRNATGLGIGSAPIAGSHVYHDIPFIDGAIGYYIGSSVSQAGGSTPYAQGFYFEPHMAATANVDILIGFSVNNYYVDPAATIAGYYGLIVNDLPQATTAVGLDVQLSAGSGSDRWGIAEVGAVRNVMFSDTVIGGGTFGSGFPTLEASAKLEVRSTTQGFLPPVHTTTQRNAVASPANGLLLYNSTLGSLDLRAAGSWVSLLDKTVAAATYQPLDSDLTAIAALTTTSYGRAFLALADAAAGRTALSLGTLATQSGTFSGTHSGTSSGTNTGDQTSIVGITGTIAQFNTACTDADFSTGGGTATGTNTGDETGARVATLLHAASSKTTLVDADELNGTDSANSYSLIRATCSNIANYIWTKFGALIAAGTQKATLVVGDMFAIADSASSNATKYATLTNVRTAVGSPLGIHMVPVMAGAIAPSVAGGCSYLTAIASAANQPDIITLDFDASTEEYAQFTIPMPESWDEGTITAAFIWSHAATASNFGVVWALQAVAVSDDDTIAVAYGTAQTVTDTGGTTNDVYISGQTSAITIAGTPQPGDLVCFRVYRKAADGSDTMTIDARLHGVKIYMTLAAGVDA